MAGLRRGDQCDRNAGGSRRDLRKALQFVDADSFILQPLRHGAAIASGGERQAAHALSAGAGNYPQGAAG